MSDSLPASGQSIAPKKSAFGQSYWMLNSIEMFERLAYFGIRAVVPLYIMQATEPGGLHLTAIDKGWIYMWWAILQSWLPMFTGGIADRYGYKRVLFFAICTNSIGYLMMASFHSYHGFFAGILVLATGTAFFKPALQGSLAQNLTKENSSMGWGIFYWVVNIGGVTAPILATMILGIPHSAEGWRNLFLASSAYTAVNLLLLLTFKDVPSGADKSLGLGKVFIGTVQNIWPFWFVGGSFHRVRAPLGAAMAAAGLVVVILASEVWYVGVLLLLLGGGTATWLQGGRFTWQLRLPCFLLIMSGFWMMMYQLWDLHPNFIRDWIDSSMVAAYTPARWVDYSDRGLLRVPQQILLNLNGLMIVALVVPVSWWVRKLRTLTSMLFGMSVATTGVMVAGLTGNGWILLLGVVFFSFGEMLTGPKKNEYLGLIAPPGKKGLYLGYVNIPIGIGVGFGSMIGGVLYDRYGEKASLAMQYLEAQPQLMAQAAKSVDWSDSLDLLPPLLGIERDAAFAQARSSIALSDAHTAETLLDAFRFDKGQVANLALQYMALLEEHRSDVASELKVAELTEANVGRFVGALPKALGINRVEALERVRHHQSQNPQTAAAGDSAMIAALWERFGHQPETLNNLALEYLAQGTHRLSGALSRMTDDKPEQMLSKLGIGRTKSFAALTAAMGASTSEVEKALAAIPASATEKATVYLIAKPQYRSTAIARRDWTDDVPFLQELIEGDAAATEVVANGLANSGGASTGKLDYAGLASKQALIQKALAAKDWSLTPRQAAQVLQLNPFEARVLVAAHVNRSAVSVTQMLWDHYHPQYYVWIPFGVVGLLATFALAIFGQMAKRWSDMNA